MISETITAAAEVILTGQTNLTTTNLRTLKGHCVFTGIMCAHTSFISVTLVIASYHSRCFHLPSRVSSPANSVMFLHFPECLSTTPEQLLHPCVTAERAMHCSESNGSRKKARLSIGGKQQVTHLTVNAKYCVAVSYYVAQYTSCRQCRNSITASSTMDRCDCKTLW